MVTGKKSKIGARVTIGFLGVFSVVWILPILFTILQSLRPYQDVLKYGIMSFPHHLSFHNYYNALVQSKMWLFFFNSVEVAVPAVFITLYDTQLGLILVHVAIQIGFATFMLTNYLRTIPKEISESALVDGANVWNHFYRIILPLLRPALASLGVLLTTWIYNDFFWSIVLLKSGNKRPITAALSNLQGEFNTDYDLLAAGAVIAFVPTLLVFFAMRKHFVAGLTLGATKG